MKCLAWAYWRRRWALSLQVRMAVFGLAPLALALPLLMGVLVLLGGATLDRVLEEKTLTHVHGVQSYLQNYRNRTGELIQTLAESNRLHELLAADLHQPASRDALKDYMVHQASGIQLDFLILADQEGRVIASTLTMPYGSRVPDTFVSHQARIGVSAAEFERLSVVQLRAMSPALADRARITSPSATAPAAVDGLLIQAGSHLPLSPQYPNAFLLGGILLNQNAKLVSYVQEVIFPVGAVQSAAQGEVAILLGDTRVATTITAPDGRRAVGTSAAPEVVRDVLLAGRHWARPERILDVDTQAGYQALTNGEGRRIGMVFAGFPLAPYVQQKWLIGIALAAMLTLSMMALSLLNLLAARRVVTRLSHIENAMEAFRQGTLDGPVQIPGERDEIGSLARHFDSLIDTLARKSAQERHSRALVTAEASRRQALFEHVHDGIVVLRQDGSVLEANRKFMDMLGYTESEMKALNVLDWNAEYDSLQMDPLLRGISTQGVVLQTVHKRKDGTCYDVESSVSRIDWGGETYILAIHRDITERKRLETSLALKSAEINTILENLSAGVIYVKDRHIAFANRRMGEMFGYSTQEMQGWSTEFIYLDHDAYIGAGAKMNPLLAQGEQGSFEIQMRHRQGRIFWTRLSGKLLDVNNPASGSIWVLEDIDAYKKLEIDLKTQNAELIVTKERAEAANVAKGQFLSMMSHELRTPLNSIMGMYQLIDIARPGPLVQGYAQQGMRSSAHLLQLIDDILDFSRFEAGRIEMERAPFSLGPLLASVAESCLKDDAPQVDFSLDADTGLFQGQLVGDALRLKQVLINLVGNALKFTPTGSVVLGVKEVARSSEQVSIEFSVTDTGIGMSPEQISKLFQPFTQADMSIRRRFGGTGLGLSISERLVKLMGGSGIEVRSAPGQGSRFALTLSLPLVSGPQAEVAPVAVAALTASSLEGLHILLVEDDPANQFTIEMLLKRQGAQVTLAEDGAQAVTLALGADPPHDVVLMDINMPVKSGLDATRELRAAGYRRAILALTANAFEQDRQDCLRAGMDDFIPKPVLLPTLIDKIRRYCPAQGR